MDHEIGRVLAAIEAYCGKDTVVVFTSNHGDHLGAFGLCAKGPTMYDHTLAVPLIVRAPALSLGNRRVSELVSSLDLWPTILELASQEGIEQRSVHEARGTSLVPLLSGGASGKREAIFSEYNRFAEHLSQVDGFFPIRCIRTQDWKLVINLFDRDELYDLNNEPHESANLIDDTSPRLRAELHERLLEWQEATRDLFRGPCWRERPWRQGGEQPFEGLFTTGYKDAWSFGRFER